MVTVLRQVCDYWLYFGYEEESLKTGPGFNFNELQKTTTCFSNGFESPL